MSEDNTAQQLAENLLTDPDEDAERAPPPSPPQTIEAEPSGGHPAPPPRGR